MSDAEKGPSVPKRLAPPFPSRQEVHGARIPQGTKDQPAETAVADSSSASSTPAPPTTRREAPRRPRTTVIEPTQPVAATTEPQVSAVENLPQPTGSQPTEIPSTPRQVELDPPADEPTFEVSEGIVFKPIGTVPAAGSDLTPALPGGTSGVQPEFMVTDGITDVEEDAATLPASGVPFPKRVSPVTGAQPSLQQPEPLREQIAKSGAQQKRRRRRNRRIWTVVIVLAILILGGVGGWYAFSSLRGGPALTQKDDYPAVDWQADPASHPLVDITVEPGQIGSEIGNSLVEADVVKSLKAFTRAFDANPASASIKPGTYTVPTRIPAADALAALLDETNRSENTISVNAGQTVSQIAEKMVSVAGFTQEEVDAAVTDPSSVTSLPSEANGNLEGWLWPGSYDFSPSSTPSEIFDAMVQPMVSYLNEQGVPKDQWEETLIKASIVEREVNRVEDMPKVARVIMNRIEDPEGPTRGMLQMDSTVTYGVGGTGGLPNSAAFEDDNPYNTYIVKGLPAGPIASPSEDAIDAVLNPVEGDWFYFVTVNLTTGETIFTDSHEELGVLTEQLIEWCEANPGECRN